jgi:hypothetical protein
MKQFKTPLKKQKQQQQQIDICLFGQCRLDVSKNVTKN